jgi:hypothetical protein
MELLICIAVYLLSTLFVWNWLRIAFSEKGTWSVLKPTRADFFMTICPVLNTVNVFVLLFVEGPYKDNSSEFVNKFFKDKK